MDSLNKRVSCCKNNKVNPGEFQNIHDSLTLKKYEWLVFNLCLPSLSFKKFLSFSAASFMVIFLFVYGHCMGMVFVYGQTFNATDCGPILHYNSIRAAIKPLPLWINNKPTSLDIRGCEIFILLILFDSCTFILDAPLERCWHVGRFLARFLQHRLCN